MLGDDDGGAGLSAQRVVPLADLGEQVDHRVLIGAQAEWAAGAGQRAGRSDPVGQVWYRPLKLAANSEVTIVVPGAPTPRTVMH
jgi:hypothetical protein